MSVETMGDELMCRSCCPSLGQNRSSSEYDEVGSFEIKQTGQAGQTRAHNLSGICRTRKGSSTTGAGAGNGYEDNMGAL
jgi:hypothetical protein